MSTSRGLRVTLCRSMQSRVRHQLLFALAAACAVTSACQGPVDVPLSVERNVLPDTGDSFYIRGGTLTNTNGFFLSSGVDSVCGAGSYQITLPGGIVESPYVQVCGPSSLNAQRREVLDGGFVKITGAVNADTTQVGQVDGSWDQEFQVYHPTGMTAVLTAHTFGGYHFAEWTIKTLTGQFIRHSTSLTITRARGSNEQRFEAYFQQNATP